MNAPAARKEIGLVIVCERTLILSCLSAIKLPIGQALQHWESFDRSACQNRRPKLRASSSSSCSLSTRTLTAPPLRCTQ